VDGDCPNTFHHGFWECFRQLWEIGQHNLQKLTVPADPLAHRRSEGEDVGVGVLEEVLRLGTQLLHNDRPFVGLCVEYFGLVTLLKYPTDTFIKRLPVCICTCEFTQRDFSQLVACHDLWIGRAIKSEVRKSPE
jgi:hypothetical protein